MNILLTAIGRRDYLIDYLKSLNSYNCHVIAANSLPNTTGMWKADKSYITPEIRSKEYIPSIIEICKIENVDILISLFDLDTLFLAYHKKDFEVTGTRLILSDLSVIETCSDKLKMSGYLQSIGLVTPRVFTSIEEVKKLLTTNKELSFPLVLKPQWGQGSIATEIVYNIEELLSAYTLLNNKVKNTSIAHIEHLPYTNQLLIQEFIKGEEYGVDCINNLEGVHQAVVIKRKLAMRAGETDGAVTVYDAQIKKAVSYLGQKLAHTSIIDIDVIKRGDEVFIIDMNPRFGGGYPFSHQAGVNLPQAILDWHTRGSCDPQLLAYSEGVMSLKGINMVSKTGREY